MKELIRPFFNNQLSHSVLISKSQFELACSVSTEAATSSLLFKAVAMQLSRRLGRIIGILIAILFSLYCSASWQRNELAESTRPDPDTLADIPKIISACRGSPEKLELVRHVQKCLVYLADYERDYLILPQANDSSRNSNLTCLGRLLSKIPKLNRFSLRRGCSDTIFRYHAYWSGEFTWRVELFIKSYLFTQNYPCSQLWLWIDTTHIPLAIEETFAHPLVRQFHPLIVRGYIVLKSWVLPKKVPVPSGLDHTDGLGFMDNPERRGVYPDSAIIADSVIRDLSCQHWLLLDSWVTQTGYSTVPMSDIFRFVVLHLHGGLYLDVDMLLLRDMRPLLLSGVSFAERWGALSGSGDYNTAVLRLTANSSLSTYLLRTGVRLGLNFHPRTIGRIAEKDGWASELLMFETAAFDPVWPEFASMRQGECTRPCFTNFAQAFQASFGTGTGTGTAILLHENDTGRSSAINTSHQSINHTLRNFFSGAFTYHIHNQWLKIAEPGSWIDAIKQAHDEFFTGNEPNVYNEWWDGSLGLQGYGGDGRDEKSRSSTRTSN